MTTSRRDRNHRLLAGALLVLLAVFVVLTLRLFVFPARGGLPSRVDAIVKLGGWGDRAAVAEQLARDQRAPVLVDSTLEPIPHGCVPDIPGVQEICFNPNPPTTRGEAEFVGNLAARSHWTSVVLVTTRDQAWRARLRMHRCFDGAIYSSTAKLPRKAWLWEIPYQWAATVKALFVEPTC